MVQTLKLYLVPGSVQFLAVALLVGVALLYAGARMQRWGRRVLTAVLPFYLFISTPVGSDLVALPLVWRYAPVQSADQVRGIDTVVVLTTGVWVYEANGLEVDEMGKSSSHNAMEAARLYRLMGSPTVVVTGGYAGDYRPRFTESEVMAEGLGRLGVPRERMILETKARNTLEQASNSAELLRRRGTRRVVLVTDSEHMPRALSMFRARGLDPVPSVSIMSVTTPPGLLNRLRPNLGAYLQSDRACYEYSAHVYYWCRGLLGLEEG